MFALKIEFTLSFSDYNKLFGNKCKGCGSSIGVGDHYVEAIKAQWHDRCFTCAVRGPGLI